MAAQRTYFYGDREIDEDDALDENGIVRDGVTMRCPVMMRDSLGRELTDAMRQPLTSSGRQLHRMQCVFCGRNKQSLCPFDCPELVAKGPPRRLKPHTTNKVVNDICF